MRLTKTTCCRLVKIGIGARAAHMDDRYGRSLATYGTTTCIYITEVKIRFEIKLSFSRPILGSTLANTAVLDSAIEINSKFV